MAKKTMVWTDRHKKLKEHIDEQNKRHYQSGYEHGLRDGVQTAYEASDLADKLERLHRVTDLEYTNLEAINQFIESAQSAPKGHIDE